MILDEVGTERRMLKSMIRIGEASHHALVFMRSNVLVEETP